MPEPQVHFNDGAAYEEFMGKWSLLAGAEFLHWLAPPSGLRWADVGCGNGAFTQLLIERCTPLGIEGCDPSPEQLAYARERLPGTVARFQTGDAMVLPYADAAFDAAVMALVIFFVPDPAKAVAEMARVVVPGGSVSAYAWDMLGGGFPFAAMHEEMTELGSPPMALPSIDASRIDTLRSLWAGAGLVQIETREISVQRTFDDFETFWRIAQSGPRIAPRTAAMPSDERERLKSRMRARLKPDASGRITYSARANAIKGLKARAIKGRHT